MKENKDINQKYFITYTEPFYINKLYLDLYDEYNFSMKLKR